MGSGGVYLHSLTERAGTVSYHAPRVIAGWRRAEARAAIATCWQIVNGAGLDVDEHLEQVRQRIETVTAYAGATALRPNSEAVYEVLAHLEDDEEPGLSTGYADLDEAIGTLRGPDLIVIGGRPGNGKSLMGLCIADHVGTRLKVPVLVASLEMTEGQLTQRRIAATARVPLVNIVRHQATDDDWQRISRAQDRLADTALHIDDTSSASIARIRARLREMARTGNPARLLVIDYLGFMSMPKAESRQQAVAEVARQCKNGLAREFGIPVILLCQLNRLIEGRADKRPTLSDLRESGEIEQSADIVILLHREDVYERESPRAGEIDLIIQKNRQGPLTTVTLLFQGHYGRIVSMSREDRDSDSAWSPSSAVEHR
jgi:replicative DNA helicase